MTGDAGDDTVSLRMRFMAIPYAVVAVVLAIAVGHLVVAAQDPVDALGDGPGGWLTIHVGPEHSQGRIIEGTEGVPVVIADHAGTNQTCFTEFWGSCHQRAGTAAGTVTVVLPSGNITRPYLVPAGQEGRLDVNYDGTIKADHLHQAGLGGAIAVTTTLLVVAASAAVVFWVQAGGIALLVSMAAMAVGLLGSIPLVLVGGAGVVAAWTAPKVAGEVADDEHGEDD